MVAVPDAWLEQYLGGDALVSLLVVAVLGALIYVCAVAHIPSSQRCSPPAQRRERRWSFC